MQQTLKSFEDRKVSLGAREPLGASPDPHMTRCVVAQSGEKGFGERCFADPGIARDADHLPSSPLCFRVRGVQEFEFIIPAHGDWRAFRGRDARRWREFCVQPITAARDGFQEA